MSREQYWAIVETSPAEKGIEYFRIVELFDNEADAKTVLSALEQVNIMFNRYTIEVLAPNTKVHWEVRRDSHA